MTQEQILRIIKQHGKFCVSLRWRDIPLQKLCNTLVKDNVLHKVGRLGREIVYVAKGQKYKVSHNRYLQLEAS
jgi:hypothetical protein